MTLALDTNVLQALLEKNHPLQVDAVQALKKHREGRQLVISPFVYAEAFGMPGFDETTFQAFLNRVGISLNKTLPDGLWRRAGEAHAAYHVRRRRQGQSGQKRVLVDFLVGAHALSTDAPLLTFDPKGYRAAFPELLLLPSE